MVILPRKMSASVGSVELQRGIPELFLVHVGAGATRPGVLGKVVDVVGRAQEHDRAGMPGDDAPRPASRPPISGMLMSMRTRSGCNESVPYIASRPFAASPTSSKPSSATQQRPGRRGERAPGHPRLGPRGGTPSTIHSPMSDSGRSLWCHPSFGVASFPTGRSNRRARPSPDG